MTEEEEFEFRARLEKEQAAPPKEEIGAAFGIYPKQRATPSKPETQQAMRGFGEMVGKGVGALGFIPPEEPEFAPGQIATTGAVGAAGGAAAPSVLRGLGRVASAIPTAPTRAAGAGLQALGTALQATPVTRRAAVGGGTFAGAETGGQLAGLAGLPPIVGAGPGAVLGSGRIPGRGLVQTLRGQPVQEAQASLQTQAEATRRIGSEALEAQERAAQQAALAEKSRQETIGLQQEEKRAIASRTAEKQQAARGRTLRELAGVRTLPGESEFGGFKPIPQTLSDIGNYARTQAENFVKNIKVQRSNAADANFTASKTEAANKEALGQFVDTEPIVAKLMNLEAKGGSADYLSSIRRLRKDIERTKGFEGLEIIRRRAGDAAFGVPEEGYKAIGQQLAKDVYGDLATQMRSFSKGFGKYLDDYKRLSEPIEVYGTRVGKGLIEKQDSAGRYFAKNADEVAKDIFASPENFAQFVDAVGGNKQIAEAAARRYFANLAESAKTPEAIEELFKNKNNRALLDQLPGIRQEIRTRYLEPMIVAKRRETAALGIKEEAKTKIENVIGPAIAQADDELAKRLKNISQGKTLVSDSINALVAAKPGKVINTFDNTVLPKIREAEQLAGVKIIDEGALQNLRQQVVNLEKTSDKVQRTRLITGAIATFLLGQQLTGTIGKLGG